MMIKYGVIDCSTCKHRRECKLIKTATKEEKYDCYEPDFDDDVRKERKNGKEKEF